MEYSASPSLPALFTDLEGFVEHWARATTDARHHQRQMSSMEEIRTFYSALQSRMPGILQYLDQFPLEDLPSDARCLMQLAFSFIEAALAVELFQVPGVADVPYPHGLGVAEELPAMVLAMRIPGFPSNRAPS